MICNSSHKLSRIKELLKKSIVQINKTALIDRFHETEADGDLFLTTILNFYLFLFLNFIFYFGIIFITYFESFSI